MYVSMANKSNVLSESGNSFGEHLRCSRRVHLIPGSAFTCDDLIRASAIPSIFAHIQSYALLFRGIRSTRNRHAVAFRGPPRMRQSIRFDIGKRNETTLRLANG